MLNSILPLITQREIDRAKEDTWDFLFLFLDKYDEIISSSSKDEDEVLDEFTDEQHMLMEFNVLYGQVTNGGFIQLIQNGYGSYIFDNPFADGIKAWGATATAEIVDLAKVIYDTHRDDLERERTLDEFSKMYKTYPDFAPLEDRFYEIIDQELEIIKEFISNNLHLFATLS